MKRLRRRARKREQVAQQLAHAVRTGRLSLVGVCVKRLARWGGEQSAATIAAALDEASEPVAETIVAALALFESPGFEALWVGALDHRLRTVRLGAAAVLGRVGSADAVAPLRDWATRDLFDRRIQAAAREAIAEIQSRLEGASPGQLSIAGAEAGQVSLAGEDRRGEVSLEAEEEARRS